ncbi:uncharacterized protein LOC116849794 [Odontomachus brunneus]|uniref:uncharacterized protein LOC116849794 n=1 Tax=Odontomachus brunneus TaxID=486640 RepID=UPI0013F207BB|nr:uncharacterized protein LOC116849794 [Odontomachus brunneus]XP_032683213.1 uncharacterized protein LOC116849794 [Odontomachus brunneus]XP_032683214.1 uncharacterized protein LOC116849794 [Odontomachus brunneus]XP_032683215.1 uncharacterized protein LOC116849794 [Odontomachus brunneus]XP_032683216.1 uncharacterized protein LOC116849794 [Odontomachus brunneus]XP_032683217.1 uncharacterized protein LOC116849794 [Odontomachus brunneus]XP_032683218.1 uncharacterized protein LOC116849794 [Odonto
MQFRQPAIWSLIFLPIGLAYAGISNWDACSGRLEHALDALHRDSTRRNKLDEEETGISYQRELHSAPLEMSVSRMAVKLPENTKEPASHWARVERCVFEPERNSLRTRVVFNDLSVSGMVSLMPRDHRTPVPAESCKMMLRLRRAGIDFLTSPIARGRGQMRIRTESSFLEPRFASIYAYGCRPTRLDKQIKRQDKWPPYHSSRDKITPPTPPLAVSDKYDAAEPRQLVGITEEVDVVVPNESRHPHYSRTPKANFGVWRKNSWITKSPLRRRRSVIRQRLARAAHTMVVAPRDFIAHSLVTERDEEKASTKNKSAYFVELLNLTDSLQNEDPSRNVSREVRELVLDDNFENLFPIDSADPSRSWQSKEHITREMEDVFLQGASQALTKYIERQLHPAIKETLMLSMGYTISYG